MNKFDLVIFDCDGVLVDSERIANQVFADVLNRELGFSLTLDDMFDQFVGHSSKQCMEIVERMLGAKPPSNLEALYKSEINTALKESVTAVSGIEEVLENISIPYCVASSGSHEKMSTTLGKTKLDRFFDKRIFSTSDVAKPKPFPDIYLHAAREMGVSHPSKCLVVEDSPLGVKGGIAAGMVVFGYAELTQKDKLLAAGAHHLFNQMSDLIAAINAHQTSHP